jgi:hypothetical protein
MTHVQYRVRRLSFFLRAVPAALALLFLCGCATTRPPVESRPFDFQKDTFAYANELVWEYAYDANGKWKGSRREPKPAYTHHCFVVAKVARQFFHNARFDPTQPIADSDTYRRLIQRVVTSNPRRILPEKEKIVIPGYADLRSFSEAHETLLKAECGGAIKSYFQRGHWRMVFPFSRKGQEQMAGQLGEHLDLHHALVIHLARFPQLTINHAMVLYDAVEQENRIEFSAYDPNKPDAPTVLTFDRATRTFMLPANDYFPGGRVDVYEVYYGWCY